MNKIIIAASLLAAGFSASLFAEGLTKEEELSCSALLCLSSSIGGNISECSKPLQEYYSISARKTADTIKKRRNFLSICPASEEQGMPELVNAIIQGAGRCDAKLLNTNLMEKRTIEKNCMRSRDNTTCEYETQYRINNRLPNYCAIYINHSYTDIGLHYSGSPVWQSEAEFNSAPSGKWVN